MNENSEISNENTGIRHFLSKIKISNIIDLRIRNRRIHPQQQEERQLYLRCKIQMEKIFRRLRRQRISQIHPEVLPQESPQEESPQEESPQEESPQALHRSQEPLQQLSQIEQQVLRHSQPLLELPQFLELELSEPRISRQPRMSLYRNGPLEIIIPYLDLDQQMIPPSNLRSHRNIIRNGLTLEKIMETATETKFYEEFETNHKICAITWKEFEPKDIVTMIKKCKHIFLEKEIKIWFRRSTVCPLCKYNIQGI